MTPDTGHRPLSRPQPFVFAARAAFLLPVDSQVDDIHMCQVTAQLSLSNTVMSSSAENVLLAKQINTVLQCIAALS